MHDGSRITKPNKKSLTQRLAAPLFAVLVVSSIATGAAQSYLLQKILHALDQVQHIKQSQDRIITALEQQNTYLKSISNSAVGIAYIQQEMLQKAGVEEQKPADASEEDKQ